MEMIILVGTMQLYISTTIPQLLPNAQNMDISMFFDAGNVWGVDYDQV